MAKALIVIGYHRDELKWGRKVRDRYLAGNSKNCRDVEFYEIKSSKVRQGEKCIDSEKKIIKLIRKSKDITLIIDLHCGFLKSKYKGNWPEKLRKMNPNERCILLYQSNDPNLINKVKRYDKNIMINSSLQTHKNTYGIPLAIFDFFFTCGSYRNKDKIFQEAILKATNFINDMYDLHFQRSVF